MSKPVKTKRPYDSSRRQELARQNRQSILDAARDLFLSQGYVATTIAEIATTAGVSVETIYKAIGNKAAVAKAVFDVAVVGDVEPIPMFERPEIKAVNAEPNAGKKLEMFFSHYPTRRARTGPIELVLRDAAATDPAAAVVLKQVRDELLRGMRMFATDLTGGRGIRRGLSVEQIADILYAYVSVEMYELLVLGRGWSLDRYTGFMIEALTAALT